MRDFIRLVEGSQPRANPRMHMWDFIKYYDIREAKAEFHDAMLPWINNNQPRCIDQGIKRDDYRLLSKLTFWKDWIVGEPNWAKEFATLEDFEAALSTPITLWRGGPGIYDPDLFYRNWVSFTARRERTKTFTHYNGTYASRSPILGQRHGAYWVVELTLPLNSILLYLNQGSDQEVIVSKKDAQRAEVIEQGNIVE